MHAAARETKDPRSHFSREKGNSGTTERERRVPGTHISPGRLDPFSYHMVSGTDSHMQVAVHFADLHDTPGRMKEKGVISVSATIYIYSQTQCKRHNSHRTCWSGPVLASCFTGSCVVDCVSNKLSKRYRTWRSKCEGTTARREVVTHTLNSIIVCRCLSRGEIVAMLRTWFVESKSLINVGITFQSQHTTLQSINVDTSTDYCNKVSITCTLPGVGIIGGVHIGEHPRGASTTFVNTNTSIAHNSMLLSCGLSQRWK